MAMNLKGTYEDKEVTFEQNSIEILGDDGISLFTIDLKEDGSLEVHTGSFVKHNDVILDTNIVVTAKGGNWFKLRREVYSK